jgi:hypothetical protein
VATWPLKTIEARQVIAPRRRGRAKTARAHHRRTVRPTHNRTVLRRVAQATLDRTAHHRAARATLDRTDHQRIALVVTLDRAMARDLVVATDAHPRRQEADPLAGHRPVALLAAHRQGRLLCIVPHTVS